MFSYNFESPQFLWLLCILPLMAFWYWYKRKQRQAEIRFTDAGRVAEQSVDLMGKVYFLPLVLRLLAVAFIIVALARPRTSEESTKTKNSEGIDIVMAVDVSTSMMSRDLRPNRLEATKDVAATFIKERPSDRIGLVVYSGESFTQTPLTTDHKILLNALKDVKFGMIEDGTAIGMGLATAVNRLKESTAKSKVIILLTDGENNAGQIDPLTAAQLAEEFNIRVYTIGVGTKGTAPSPHHYDFSGNIVFQNMPVSIDEDLLKDIASQTGGQYFRATDNNKLESIYEEIDQLEKTKLEELKFYTYDEKFDEFALIALILFAAEILLRYTVFKSFV